MIPDKVRKPDRRRAGTAASGNAGPSGPGRCRPGRLRSLGPVPGHARQAGQAPCVSRSRRRPAPPPPPASHGRTGCRSSRRRPGRTGRWTAEAFARMSSSTAPRSTGWAMKSWCPSSRSPERHTGFAMSCASLSARISAWRAWPPTSRTASPLASLMRTFFLLHRGLLHHWRPKPGDSLGSRGWARSGPGSGAGRSGRRLDGQRTRHKTRPPSFSGGRTVPGSPPPAGDGSHGMNGGPRIVPAGHVVVQAPARARVDALAPEEALPDGVAVPQARGGFIVASRPCRRCSDVRSMRS